MSQFGLSNKVLKLINRASQIKVYSNFSSNKISADRFNFSTLTTRQIVSINNYSKQQYVNNAIARFSAAPQLVDLDDDKNNKNDDERQKRIRRVLSTIATLILFFWMNSRTMFVEAAKPIFPNYEDREEYDRDHSRQDGDHLKKGEKKSNREKYNFISKVVDKVADTVVCIEVKDHSHVDFFSGTPNTASNGSGFIISEDGLILTNAHVVAAIRSQRTSFSVRLHDGRTFIGVVEDIDHASDLATIRINAKKLPTMPLGCSSETKIGEWVVAVGAPLNFNNTITAGVVSSINRTSSELGMANDINYIQTDAAITFGNSGGPLINLDGEAIGINSMKVTAGISFAIPIDHAKKFLARAESRRASGIKKPSRRYMGLTILSLTEQIRRELESRGYTKLSHGVLVWQVVVGSPAYLAGIHPGDIIVRINGTDIKSSAELYEMTKSADKLIVHVQRGDKLYSCTVTPECVED